MSFSAPSRRCYYPAEPRRCAETASASPSDCRAELGTRWSDGGHQQVMPPRNAWPLINCLSCSRPAIRSERESAQSAVRRKAFSGTGSELAAGKTFLTEPIALPVIHQHLDGRLSAIAKTEHRPGERVRLRRLCTTEPAHRFLCENRPARSRRGSSSAA